MIVPITLNNMPTAGALLGTAGTRALVDSINGGMGLSPDFFGSVHDVFNSARSIWMQNIVEPIRVAYTSLKNTANKLLMNDVYIPIVKDTDFEFIPPCMHMPILMYAPVQELFKQGRIDGFGYDPDWLPTEDVYGRLISNGTIDDIANQRDKEGNITFTWIFDTTDPDLTFEEIDYIEQTRAAIDLLLKRKVDPTNFPRRIG
jgi:hypothetical protein